MIKLTRDLHLTDKRNRMNYHQIISSVRLGNRSPRILKSSRYNLHPGVVSKVLWNSSIKGTFTGSTKELKRS